MYVQKGHIQCLEQDKRVRLFFMFLDLTGSAVTSLVTNPLTESHRYLQNFTFRFCSIDSKTTESVNFGKFRTEMG